MMSWHILRKDWKLLWPLGLLGAASNALLTTLRYQLVNGHGSDALAAVLTLALVVAIVLLIVLAVQQDAMAGGNQDWLVRPIERRDLLLAKLLLVALVIHAPMVACNLCLSLAESFPPLQSLGAAVVSTLDVALVFTLPTLAIASLTRSLTEAVIGAVLALLAILATYGILSLGFDFGYAAQGTGVRWVWSLLAHALLLLTTLSALCLQYFRRSTLLSRVIFTGGLLLFMLAPGLPWQPAFAIQRWLSADPAAARGVQIAFDPAVSEPARIFLEDDADDDEEHEDEDGHAKGSAKDTGSVVVPLRAMGIPAGMVLHADRSSVRLVDSGGHTVYRGLGGGFDLIPGAKDHAEIDAAGEVREVIPVPEAIYRRKGATQLRLELDYSLTLLRPRELPLFAAIRGHGTLPGGGHCTSSVAAQGAAIEVRCRTLGEIPCVALHLRQGALRSADRFACDLNYQPAVLRFTEDPIDHLTAKLSYRDVDAGRLRDTQVVMEIYEPVAHFSRRLVVPDAFLEKSRSP